MFLLLTAALPVHFQSSQLVQGTQRRPVLLNDLLALVTRDADLFTAVVTEPACLDRQPVLPGGACIWPDGRRDELKSFSGFAGW